MSGNQDLDITEGFANHGYLTSDPVKYNPDQPPMRIDREDLKSKKRFAGQLDPNHSHFILVSWHVKNFRAYKGLNPTLCTLVLILK